MMPEQMSDGEPLSAGEAEPPLCDPKIIYWTAIHWNELAPVRIVSEHIAGGSQPHTVHIPVARPSEREAYARGPLLPYTSVPFPADAPGVTTVYMREQPDGHIDVTDTPPAGMPGEWREHRMRDLNRINTQLPPLKYPGGTS